MHKYLVRTTLSNGNGEVSSVVDASSLTTAIEFVRESYMHGWSADPIPLSITATLKTNHGARTGTSNAPTDPEYLAEYDREVIYSRP